MFYFSVNWVLVCVITLQGLLMLPERSQDSLLASMDFIFTLLAIPLMAVTLLVGLFLCLCYCIQYGFAEFYLL